MTNFAVTTFIVKALNMALQQDKSPCLMSIQQFLLSCVYFDGIELRFLSLSVSYRDETLHTQYSTISISLTGLEHA